MAFWDIFNKKPQTPLSICERTIKRMGYKKEQEGTYIKEVSNGRSMIWLSENGVKIKVYVSGYAESDFLPAPLPDAMALKKFIHENEI